MKKILFVCYFSAIGIILIESCTYHDLGRDSDVVHTDETLFDEVNVTDGYQYYVNGNTLPAAIPSPHGSFKLRFNQIAWEALDSNGELPSGKGFPNGSVLVKEVYNADGLFVYAVMKKEPSDASAGNGWLWAEYFPDGAIAFSIERRGNGCISCHSEVPNRDLVRTFDLH